MNTEKSRDKLSQAKLRLREQQKGGDGKNLLTKFHIGKILYIRKCNIIQKKYPPSIPLRKVNVRECLSKSQKHFKVVSSKITLCWKNSLTYNWLFLTHCDLNGELSHWHSYFLFLSTHDHCKYKRTSIQKHITSIEVILA